MVALYAIVLSLTRAKRSTRWHASLCGTPLSHPAATLVAIQPFPLKLVVSTTSVSPSQRPRESPSHDLRLASRCGRPSRGIDPGFVNHLGMDHDVIRRLHDLMTVVVAAGKQRAGHAARDAALPWPVMFDDVRGQGEGCVSLFHRLRPQRDSAVRRIHDHRRPPGTDRTFLNEPVGRAHCWPTGTLFFSREPFEWRRVVVGPHALQVRPSGGRSTHGPFFFRALRVGLRQSDEQRTQASMAVAAANCITDLRLRSRFRSQAMGGILPWPSGGACKLEN